MPESLPLFAGLTDPARSTVRNTGCSFRDFVRGFSQFGQPTLEREEDGIPYLVNEFWTSGQRQAHSIHEISYRACFKPQLPAFFIERLTEPGDVVYDPFMGRGTTLVEAALHGRRPMGNDVNPLSVLLTRPRLRRVSLRQIQDVLGRVDWRSGVAEPEDLLAFYSPSTLRQITALRDWLRREAPLDAVPDPAVDWVRMVALNRLTGHSPGFFSVYTLPPNQAVSVSSQRRINERRGQTPPDRDVAGIIMKKSKSLLAEGPCPDAEGPLLCVGPAWRTPAIADASVSLVVTSPPFLDIVQYADDNWLRCWFAGINVDSVEIAHHRTEAAWRDMVKRTLTELARVVKPGGHVAFEVGEVRGGKVLLERLVWEAAADLPFERQFVMVNEQEFTKTANCWGVRNNTGGTNTNRVVILRRTHGATLRMDDQSRIQVLENVLQQMLKPIKDVPFDLIIKSLSQFKVIKTRPDDLADSTMLAQLEAAIMRAGRAIHRTPIRRPRPNEVGNDVEAYVMEALAAEGLRPIRPTSSNGKGKSTGYPDLLFYDRQNRPTYLECKIFAAGTDPTTMRSFYVSPSESFKVSMDARHLLLAYAMVPVAVPGSRDSEYTPIGYKLADLHDLLCDVKYEFNSDNKRLYSDRLVLLKGDITPDP
jgi:hypothetical protein